MHLHRMAQEKPHTRALPCMASRRCACRRTRWRRASEVLAHPDLRPKGELMRPRCRRSRIVRVAQDPSKRPRRSRTRIVRVARCCSCLSSWLSERTCFASRRLTRAVERRSTGPCLAAHSHPVVPHPTRYGTMSSLVEWSPSSVSRVYSIRESGNQRRRCVLLRPRRSHRTLGSVRYSWYLRREGLSPK